MARKNSGKSRYAMSKTKVYFFFLFFFFFILLFYIWQWQEATGLSYRLNRLREKLSELENENCELKTKIYSDVYLEKLDRTAREQRGMIFPSNEDVVFLKVGKEIAVRINER